MDAKSCLLKRAPTGRWLPPLSLAALALVLAGTAGCSKSPEEVKAEKAKIEAQTTGRLAVKSNRPNTVIEATRVPAAGEAASAARNGVAEGAAEQTLSSLPPGKYTIIARSQGWPDLTQEATVQAGQTTPVTIEFKSGSLRVESLPVGATVKFGTNALGKTPLTVPQLPPGEIQLTLEYPLWPALPFKTTITENAETAETLRLPHGKLVVESNPSGAAVLFSGRSIGQTPLTIERFQAGEKKLTLQAKDFPPLEVALTMDDRGEVTIRAVLANGFPELDPVALLHAVWVEGPAEDKERLAPAFSNATGYRSRNGIVKNLNRKKLAETWLDKRYRFIAILKSYDRESGQLEFAEEKGDLSRYRVLAKLSASARSDRDLAALLVKDATFSLHGFLSAVEEPSWPAKVITFEFSGAEAMPVAQ